MLDSFTGSNFRENSLVKVDALEDRKAITVEQACELVMQAADRSAPYTLIPGKSSIKKVAHAFFETFYPEFVAYFTRRHAPPMPKL